MLGIDLGSLFMDEENKTLRFSLCQVIELAWCIKSKDSSTHFNLLNQTPKPNFAISFANNQLNTLV